MIQADFAPAMQALIVDDDPTTTRLASAALSDGGFSTAVCRSAVEALEHLESCAFDVILTDLQMPEMDGIEFCRRVAASYPDTPVVVMTGYASTENAIAALRVGAHDFIAKPLQLEGLVNRLKQAAESKRLRAEVTRLRESVGIGDPSSRMVGNSPAMQQVRQLLSRIAGSSATVLISGESGTGKELVAQELHARSGRTGEFVAVNCSALPAALLESELFGHAKGAFTDARASRPGLFVNANGGTLFLDEIGELPIELQPKLLRALQERKIRAVGGDREVPIDVRIVAATNRDLETEVEDGRFREDLFFRIAVIHVHVPPLRERGSDVLALAQQFVRAVAEREGKRVDGVSADVAKKLLEYPWPGNVRELQNCIEQAIALSRYSEVTVDDLPERIARRSPRPTGPVDVGTLVPLAEVERRYIEKVLNAVEGNKARAARILGVGRKTLYRKMELYGLTPPAS